MGNLNLLHFCLITKNSLFFAINVNLYPNNTTITLSVVQNLPYYETQDTFGASFRKIAVFILYLLVLPSLVYRVQIILILLTCLLNIFLLFSPSLLPISFYSITNSYTYLLLSSSTKLSLFD